MIPLFLGLTAVNLLSLTAVFVVGLALNDAGGEAASLYTMHVMLGILAGLACALTHVAVFTYFMATTKWLGAATVKASLDESSFVADSLRRKGRAFVLAMVAIVATTVTMIGGAGADKAVSPLWTPQLHLLAGALTIALNFLCAIGEYKLIAVQGRQMDEAAAILCRQLDVQTKRA